MVRVSRPPVPVTVKLRVVQVALAGVMVSMRTPFQTTSTPCVPVDCAGRRVRVSNSRVVGLAGDRLHGSG